MDYRNQILIGDCRTTMKELPDGCVHTCVTSPPYFGLRDYGHDSQIGLEETPSEFIESLVTVFAEVHRVLRDDGILWVNMGDSYAGSWGAQSRENPGNQSSSNLEGGSMLSARQIQSHPKRKNTGSLKNTPGIKAKDVIGIPWMMAFALRDWGWYLRQEIIWHKPAPMPESVTDRCTKAHEQIFLLAKSPRYFFDAEAIKVTATTGNNGSSFNNGKTNGTHSNVGKGERSNFSRRNKRSVWSVSHQGFKGAHFAVFPPKLIEPCILAGSPEKCCSACGMPYQRVIEKERIPTRPGTDSKVNRASDDPDSPYESHSGMVVGNRDPRRHVTATRTVGFEPGCECGAESSPGVVLDPFAGSGTTAQVAQDNGRDWIMCEANSEYVEMIRKRTVQPTLF